MTKGQSVSLTWKSVSSKLRFFWLTISSTSESVEDDLLSGYRLQSSRVIRHAAHQPENNEKGVAKNNQVIEKQNDFQWTKPRKEFPKNEPLDQKRIENESEIIETKRQMNRKKHWENENNLSNGRKNQLKHSASCWPSSSGVQWRKWMDLSRT